MATKNARKPALNADEPVSLNLSEAYDGDELSSALSMMYAEAGIEEGTAAKAYVTKFLAEGKEARVWEGAPADYNLMDIARRFGSGDYRLKIYVRHETGRMVFAGGSTFPVLLEPAEDLRIEASRNPAPVAAPANTLSAPDIAQMISAAIRDAMPKQNPVDPFAMMREVAGLMQMLQPAPPANQMQSLKDAAELLRVLTPDRGSELPAEGAGPYDVFAKLVDRFAGPIAEAVTKGNPAPSPARIADASAQPEGTNDVGLLNKLGTAARAAAGNVEAKMKMGIDFLLQQFEAGGAAGTYAEVVLDSVPEEALKQFVNREDWLDYLAQFNPRVKESGPAVWFGELRMELIAILSAPPDEAGNAEQPEAGAASG